MPTIEEKIKQENLPMVIWGAGLVGEALFFACRSKGIAVDAFYDSNINRAKIPVCGLPVLHTAQLKVQFPDCVFLISAADIKDVIEQLGLLGYSKWYAGSLLLEDFDIAQGQFSKSAEFVEYSIETCRRCHDSFLDQAKIFLRSVDIVITERCSMKCKDCANLMQYYERPVNYQLDEILQWIDDLCLCVDQINEFRVIGGEPFMNKEIHLVVKKLIDEPRVKRIAIYTNATILPREEQLPYFKNSKVLFMITDYDALSRNLSGLIALLDTHKITYNAHKPERWTDSGQIKKHNRSLGGQKRIFTNCCAKNTLTLSQGELHRCPFSANVLRLHAVPDYKEDYVHVSRGVRENIERTKQDIRKFLMEKTYLDVCDYCNGRSFDDLEIAPAIQTKTPLAYSKVGTDPTSVRLKNF